MVKYKNSEQSGCIICVNPDLSRVVNPLLISANKPLSAISEELIETYGVYLTENDLLKHRDHIIREIEEQEKENFKEIVEFNKDITNVDMINKEIAKLEIIENQLIENRKTDLPIYSNILKTKQKYIEMKMKIEGDNVTVVEYKLPEWIGRIKEPTPIGDNNDIKC